MSIQTLSAAPKMIIGIAGGSGSGKTTLAQRIQEVFPTRSVVISQDSYYKDLSGLSVEERAATNFDHPNSLDFSLLHNHLIELKNGRAINQPIYDFHLHCREAATRRVEAVDLVIVEGILLFVVPDLRDQFDLKIFVDTDDDLRVLRRIERDIKERGRDFKSIKEQYMTTVKPMHDAFVAPSKKYADVIFPEGGHNEIATGLILAKLHEAITLP